MSQWQRFLVEVTPDFVVRIARVQGELKQPIGAERQLDWIEDESEDGTGETFPVPPADEPCDCPLLEQRDAAALASAHESIAQRRASQMENFGRYLFATIIGPGNWRAIAEAANGTGVELALTWDREQTALHRLNWEMMHSGRQFLAAGGPDHAAITRVVNTVVPRGTRTVGFPPRVLFVVGTTMADRSIRPAAEIANLLRQLDTDATGGRRIIPRVQEKASPRSIRAAVREFGPEVVHFISHGGVDAHGDGYLELQPDESGKPEPRGADELLDYLDASAGLPAIVVLSACHSATAGRTILGGPRASGPLAAALVAGGVPIVVGMAGRVADRVSRLFAVRFGEALLSGEPLVRATAQARRVGYADGRSPRTSTDWGFPAVFTAAELAFDYRLVAEGAADPTERINRWARGYRPHLRADPVFCGREKFIRTFHELFRTADRTIPFAEHPIPKKQVLAAWSAQAKCGRTRLLKELALIALGEGHLPVLVTRDENAQPSDLHGFARDVQKAVGTVRSRRVLRADSTAANQLDILRLPVLDALEHPALDPTVRDELELGDAITPTAVNAAIACELAALLRDARARHPDVFGEHSQVVLLIDDIQHYEPLLQHFFDGLLSEFGAGDEDHPVPVVVTFTRGYSGADEFLRPVAENTSGVPWLDAIELGPWGDGEDLLAYELVLLNPWTGHDPEGIADRPWAFNDDVDDATRNRWERLFADLLEGQPNRVYTERTLFTLAKNAREENFVVEADDKQYLMESRA